MKRFIVCALVLCAFVRADSFILEIGQSFKHSYEQAKIQHSSMKKPKLVIIMDDIKDSAQYKALRKLNLPITPSLFPKTPYSPDTPKIAAIAKDYMIHLPLEALNFYQKELEPIAVGASRDSILAYMRALKNDFPNLKYLNNHTGSKFTASYEDMQNLLSVLDELGLHFIDSVTNTEIASHKIAKEQGRLIMQRDIFLDTIAQREHTHRQIDLAIQKAKQKGYVIAICHPLPSTLLSLQEAREKLLQEVDLVSPAQLESYLNSQHITSYDRSKFHFAQSH